MALHFLSFLNNLSKMQSIEQALQQNPFNKHSISNMVQIDTGSIGAQIFAAKYCEKFDVAIKRVPKHDAIPEFKLYKQREYDFVSKNFKYVFSFFI